MQVRTERGVQNKPHTLCGLRQTRLGQLAAEKHRTISADLMREYDLHLEKTRKSLLAAARLQANSQTPNSFLPLRRRRRDGVTSVLSAPSGGGRAHDDMQRCAQGMTGARLRCVAGVSLPKPTLV